MSTITAKFIEDNHPKVKELMLQRQEEQGNDRDWSVFQEDITSDKRMGGFLWDDYVLDSAEDTIDVWYEALGKGNFAPLYAMHPEWSVKDPAPPVDGEWYWVKQLEDSEWEAGLYFDGHIGESEPFFETRTCIYYVKEIHAIHRNRFRNHKMKHNDKRI